MTTLHITHNPDGISGSHTLCGAKSNRTYRTLAEGTVDRYIDRAFADQPQYANDPKLCGDCEATHVLMPAPSLPLLLQPGVDPAGILRRTEEAKG